MVLLKPPAAVPVLPGNPEIRDQLQPTGHIMQYIQLGDHQVSRYILGSNPFSGFSHQSVERDNEMRHFYTVDRIKQTIRQAEDLGVNALIARTDHHVLRMLMEYRDEGGTIQWLAQTCPEIGNSRTCVLRAAGGGAKGVHIHGGVMDHHLAQGHMDDVLPMLDLIHEHGMLAGIAGHTPGVFTWAEEHGLPVDYYMCCYYNPTNRGVNPNHIHGAEEVFSDSDREAMVATIGTLSKPVIHYKIMAAGRNDPAAAFAYAAKHMRPTDAVCVGVYLGDDDNILKHGVGLLNTALSE